jgi:hypothetical protein
MDARQAMAAFVANYKRRRAADLEAADSRIRSWKAHDLGAQAAVIHEQFVADRGDQRGTLSGHRGRQRGGGRLSALATDIVLKLIV